MQNLQQSKDMVDMVRDQVRHNFSKFKRVFDTYCACIECKRFSVQSDKTVAFICNHCGKCNSVSDAKKQYESGDYLMSDGKKGEAPYMRGDNPEYFKIRDEMEIRADMFAQGKTRDSIGLNKFSSELRRELKKANAYRGFKQTGV